MIFVNKPVPLVSTYQHDISIKTQPAEILTSGMYCLNDYLPNERVWYCMFTTERSFKVYDIRELLGEEYFHQVLNKELSIVLDLSFEPFLHAVDSIYLDVVKKHGWQQFKFEVIIICFDETCFELEKHYIKKYNSQVPKNRPNF